MSSSPYLYKLMGLSFTRSVIDKRLNPEHKLWRAVVINAFDDTMITLSDRKSSVQKIEAHNWILQESRDYREVCEWALLDPEEMKEHYISALKRKVIAFTKKQVRWAEYNKIYKVLFCDISVEQKKMIRRRLDELRREIHDTATSYTDSIILEAL
tara:strand:- start:192 stop:656 length:465 start_codon:yes stop_codon:yes gene_type:complete